MRLRFTTRRLLLFVTCWCIALGVWRTYIYEPLTHKIPLYEKAYGTRRLSKRIGPNSIRIARVVRNRRDGALVVEDGYGTSLPAAKVTHPKHLAQAAPWLDVVQMELEPGPDLLDILEVRIFDHETRTLISQLHPRFGWQVIQPNLLQVYGLGKELPAKVDVWLRVQSYDATVQVTCLKPTKGASCTLPRGVLSLQDIRSGSWAYDSQKGGYHLQLDNEKVRSEVSTVFSWREIRSGNDYQVVAVSKEGRRIHPDLLVIPKWMMQPIPVRFRLPLEEIDHFELRPFRDRHRFFFEAVQLPLSTGKAFSKPPVATLKIYGQETKVGIPDFAPLSARFAAYRGNWTLGTSTHWMSSSPWVESRAGGAIAVEEEFTLVHHLRAIHSVSWQFRFQDSITGKMKTESEMSLRNSGTSGQVRYKNFRKPLEAIQAVEITLQPGP